MMSSEFECKKDRFVEFLNDGKYAMSRKQFQYHRDILSTIIKEETSLLKEVIFMKRYLSDDAIRFLLLDTKNHKRCTLEMFIHGKNESLFVKTGRISLLNFPRFLTYLEGILLYECD